MAAPRAAAVRPPFLLGSRILNIGCTGSRDKVAPIGARVPQGNDRGRERWRLPPAHSLASEPRDGRDEDALDVLGVVQLIGGALGGAGDLAQGVGVGVRAVGDR